MRKLTFVVSAVVLGMAAMFVSCTPEDTTVSVTGIEIVEESLEITVDETKALTINVLPANATDLTYTLTVKEGEGIVEIVDNNQVKGLAGGEAVVVATTTDGEFTDECRVYVDDPNAVDIDFAGVSMYATDWNYDGSEYAMEIYDVDFDQITDETMYLYIDAYLPEYYNPVGTYNKESLNFEYCVYKNNKGDSVAFTDDVVMTITQPNPDEFVYVLDGTVTLADGRKLHFTYTGDIYAY